MPEYLSGRFFLHMEQVHLAAELAMVALCGFLQHIEMGLELFLAGKGDAVDPLQHRAVAVTAPVRAGN